MLVGMSVPMVMIMMVIFMMVMVVLVVMYWTSSNAWLDSGIVVLLVMKPQEIHAVIASIGGSYNGVNMKLRW